MTDRHTLPGRLARRAGLVVLALSAGCAGGPALTAGQKTAALTICQDMQVMRPHGPISAALGPFTLAQAYGIQDEVARRMSAAWGPVAGYKVAYTSPPAQKASGVTEPATARLFAARRIEDGGTLRASDYLHLHVEAEVAFVVGRRIDKPVADAAALRPLVRSVHPGLDIPDMRFDPAGPPPGAADAVATGLGVPHFVLGPPHDVDTIDLAKVHIRLRHDGKVGYEGPAANVMGDPWNSLLWTVNHLVGRGLVLEPGHIILSGAVDKPYRPAGSPAGQYVAEAGPLGRIKVVVQADPARRE
jgi:2-keto-4-pentenoate hydratase